jgi:predicted metal-binding membrane protein
MSYCPKCGNKVDETMTFCPNCGTSLKMGTAQPSPAPVAPVRARNEKQEKHQQNEKGEKHEKRQPSFAILLIAGIVLVFFGLVVYTDNVYHWVPSGPLAGALWTLAIGIIIIVVGLYLWTRAKRRFPAPL